MTAPVRHIREVDVPAAELARRIAAERFSVRMALLANLLAHPEVAVKPATPGERAEYRHLLYDADPDACTQPLPYPTALEAS